MFQICTIANDLSQYAALKASLLEAGFSEERCRYRLFDNSEANAYDPHQSINDVLAEATEPYVIFCHQDLLIDKGCGFVQLVRIISELEADDPKWAILGNAGVTADHRLVRRLHDPYNDDCGDDAPPVRVCSLDENFLVIRTASNIRCSSGLQGFHLYATDLCLQAAQAGYSCYVVSFYLTHLSMGRTDQSFQIARKNFQETWGGRFRFRYLGTACTLIFLSRNKLASAFFSSYRVTQWLFSNSMRHRILCRLSDKLSDQTYAG